MTRVLIIESQLKQYRRQFLVELAATLRARGIELVVAYSEPSAAERAKGDTIDLPGLAVKVPAFAIGERVVLQSAWELARDAALVIVGQANGQLLNYALLARRASDFSASRIGAMATTIRQNRHGWSEWVKRHLLGVADWWFAYTPSVARYLVEHGVRDEAITTVFNTIDVDELATAVAARDPAAVRARLGYPARADRLLLRRAGRGEAARVSRGRRREIRERVPAFELVIVGAGPERAMLEAIAHYRPYLHVVGPAFGVDRAHYFAIAEVALVPAQLGLAIVDAFAAGLPIVTTKAHGHGPELEYLSTETGRR